MKKIIIILLFLAPTLINAQSTPLAIFDNLVGKTWKATGNWGDGSKFSQEISFKYALDSSIVLSDAIGYIDKEQQQLGPRNHGIRQYDKASKSVKFWEFDVFGGLTEGKVFKKGKNIVYQYQYGESFITDMWEYVDASTYNFKVGAYKDGEWQQVYLSTQFKESKSLDLIDFYAIIKKNLAGKWSSKAWDGQLNESWSIDKNGHLNQTAQYIEQEKVLYEAANKIEIVNGELVLFTVIKDNNPKIFKATSYDKNQIIFENSDYKNPNKVVYSFLSNQEFHRTISGMEKDKATSYTFKFKRLE
jgi:hypothetical protein